MKEQSCGLQQPSGIGQRPRPLIVDYYPANVRRTDDFVERSFLKIGQKEKIFY